MKVLANDGVSQSGIDKLESAGFEVITTKVAQEQLINYLNENKVDVILVRSATKVRKDIIDACPDLKIIGRGGVGLDNIDVEYAKEKGVKVSELAVEDPTPAQTKSEENKDAGKKKTTKK